MGVNLIKMEVKIICSGHTKVILSRCIIIQQALSYLRGLEIQFGYRMLQK